MTQERVDDPSSTHPRLHSQAAELLQVNASPEVSAASDSQGPRPSPASGAEAPPSLEEGSPATGAEGPSSPEEGRPARFWTLNKFLLVLLLLVALLAGFALYGDIRNVQEEFAQFRWWLLAPALGLACLNYVLRFVKWEFFLRVLHHRVNTKRSALVFLSGFAMSVTPGKLGEVLKAYLLKRSCGVPIADTVPIVVAERLTDLISVVLLASFGVAGFSYGLDLLVAALVLCGLVIGLAFWTTGFIAVVNFFSRIPAIGKRRQNLLELQHAMVRLVGMGPLVIGSLISVVAWAAECLAFHVILTGVGVSTSLEHSFFIYALGTLAGALSMLPGGLLATEAGMVAMLVELLAIASPAQAVTAVFLVRICTLWLAVAVGAVALALDRRMNGALPHSVPDSLPDSR